MNAQDAEHFQAVMEVYRKDLYSSQVAEVFSAAQCVLYASALERYPLPRVEAALRAHVQDPERGRYFPKPADVVNACRQLSQSAAPERQTPAALPHPERLLNRPRFRALVAEATERYQRIRDETDGDAKAKARAVTAAWRRDMRAVDE